jgi:hypothetical protein
MSLDARGGRPASKGEQHRNQAATPPPRGRDAPRPAPLLTPPTRADATHKTIPRSAPKYDPLKEVVVRIDGKRVADVRGVKRLEKAFKKGIFLRKLPSGTYKVSVLAITVLKQRLSGSRTYHSCKKGSGNIKLHRGKHHHHG